MNAPMLLPSQVDWPELIGELYARGYTLRMIARECGVSRMTVRDWRAGLRVAPRGDAAVLLLRLHRTALAQTQP